MVGEFQPVGFHGVRGSVVEVSHFRGVEVGDARVGHREEGCW